MAVVRLLLLVEKAAVVRLLLLVAAAVVRQTRRQVVWSMLVDFFHGLTGNHRTRVGAYLTAAALLRRQVV